MHARVGWLNPVEITVLPPKKKKTHDSTKLLYVLPVWVSSYLIKHPSFQHIPTNSSDSRTPWSSISSISSISSMIIHDHPYHPWSSIIPTYSKPSFQPFEAFVQDSSIATARSWASPRCKAKPVPPEPCTEPWRQAPSAPPSQPATWQKMDGDEYIIIYYYII